VPLTALPVHEVVETVGHGIQAEVKGHQVMVRGPGEARGKTWRPMVGGAMDSNQQIAPVLTILVRLIARQVQVHLLATCMLVAYGGQRTAAAAWG
jgi:hypothetical protein